MPEDIQKFFMTALSDSSGFSSGIKASIRTLMDSVKREITGAGIVRVKLTGACKGCPMSQMTLKSGIERIVLKEIPEVKGVEAV